MAADKLGNNELRDESITIYLEAIKTEQDAGGGSQYLWTDWLEFHALQGDSEQAVNALRKAYELGFRNLNWIKMHPVFRKVRDNAEMQNLVAVLADQNAEELQQLQAVERELGSFQ